MQEGEVTRIDPLRSCSSPFSANSGITLGRGSWVGVGGGVHRDGRALHRTMGFSCSANAPTSHEFRTVGAAEAGFAALSVANLHLPLDVEYFRMAKVYAREYWTTLCDCERSAPPPSAAAPPGAPWRRL